MILKSFYRKKTTIIYLLIFISIFTIFGVVILGKHKYIENINQSYSESFIYLESDNSIDIKDIDGVLEHKKMVKYDILLYTYDNKIKIDENEAILPKFLENKYALNDSIEINIGNTSTTLRVKDYYEDEATVTPIIYINKELINKLESSSGKYSYIFKIKEWIKYKEIAEKIHKTYNIEPHIFTISKRKVDLFSAAKNFSIYTYIIVGIFIIVSILTVYNIVNDEKKKSYIYRSLGYSKVKILVNLIYNISSLFILSIISSIVLVLIISVILK